MQDSFDGGNGEALEFDVPHFAKSLYREANPGKVGASGHLDGIKLEIEETTLTGMQNYEKAMDSDTHWKTMETTSMV